MNRCKEFVLLFALGPFIFSQTVSHVLYFSRIIFFTVDRNSLLLWSSSQEQCLSIIFGSKKQVKCLRRASLSFQTFCLEEFGITTKNSPTQEGRHSDNSLLSREFQTVLGTEGTLRLSNLNLPAVQTHFSVEKAPCKVS